MLAPSALPKNYGDWNQTYGAPSGRRIPLLRFLKPVLPERIMTTLRGPFSIQGNSTSRAFEYPWAVEAAQMTPGMRVLEIGGGLAGFQFVLAKQGHQVVNIDPGMEARGRGWRCDKESMDRLNCWFGTSVELRNTTADKANLEPESFDRAFSISVLEHLPEDDLIRTMHAVHQALKPGGRFILTVDLFLYLAPFCSRLTNEFGRNQNIRKMVDPALWDIVQGCPDELNGFDNFDKDAVQSNLDRFLVAQPYPVLVQCLVLQKKTHRTELK